MCLTKVDPVKYLMEKVAGDSQALSTSQTGTTPIVFEGRLVLNSHKLEWDRNLLQHGEIILDSAQRLTRLANGVGVKGMVYLPRHLYISGCSFGVAVKHPMVHADFQCCYYFSKF